MSTPDDPTSHDQSPTFWQTADPTSPTPAHDAPVDADQPHTQQRSGRTWIIGSFLCSLLAAIGAIVLPHFMTFLALAAAGCAWNGMRLNRDQGTPGLGIAALITAGVVFIGCVVYTIVFVQFGFSYWENL